MVSKRLKVSLLGLVLLFFGLQVAGFALAPTPTGEGIADRSPDPQTGQSPFVFSQDGDVLASATGRGQITVLDLVSGREQVLFADYPGAEVTGMAFSPDGATLATIDDFAITLWDVVSGLQTAMVPGDFGGTVAGLTFSPDGARLAGVADQRRVLVWDLQAGIRQWVLSDSNAPVREIAFSRDGALLASSGDDDQVRIWDLGSGQEQAPLTTGSSAVVTGLAFSPAGTALAVADAVGNITLWGPRQSQPRTLTGHVDAIKGIVFSPDGRTLASDGMDAEIKLWDLAQRREKSTLPGNVDETSARLAFSPDGKLLANVNEHNEILLWEVPGGELRRILAGHDDHVAAVAFSATRRAVASVSDNGLVIVWDLDTGMQRMALQMPVLVPNTTGPLATGAGISNSLHGQPFASTSPHADEVEVDVGIANLDDQPSIQSDGPTSRNKGLSKKPRKRHWKGITALTISPDGKLIGSAGDDGSVRLWNDSLVETRVLSGHAGSAVTDVAFASNGRQLLSVGRDTVLRSWNVATGQQDQAMLAHEHPIRTIAVSPNGRYIATAGEETRIMLWNAKTGKLKAILSGHLDFVNGLAFSNNGKWLATAGADKRILLWDVQSGELLRTLRGHSEAVNAVAFSRNNQLLVSSSDDATIKLWDVATGTQIRSLAAHEAPVRAVAISPNQKFLVSAGEDARIIVWDLVSGKPLQALPGNASSVNSLIFKSTGRLLSGDEDDQITEWDINSGKKEKTRKPSRRFRANLTTEVDQGVDAASRIGLHSETVGGSSLDLAQSDRGVVPRMVSQLLDWLIPPAAAATLPDPDIGPGGPILVIQSSSSSFGDFYPEILRNEGFNEFAVVDIGTVTAQMLGGYDVVVLAEAPLTPAQVTMFTDWVNAGGNLIAMRPDAQLAGLLGLTPSGTTLSEGYILIDTSVPPGNGITNATMQFHGTADRYTLDGATSVATLYSVRWRPSLMIWPPRWSTPAKEILLGLRRNVMAWRQFARMTSTSVMRMGTPKPTGSTWVRWLFRRPTNSSGCSLT